MGFAENTLIQGLEIDTYPDTGYFFGTMTIPAHQGVGSSTLETTPFDLTLPAPLHAREWECFGWCELHEVLLSPSA